LKRRGCHSRLVRNCSIKERERIEELALVKATQGQQGEERMCGRVVGHGRRTKVWCREEWERWHVTGRRERTWQGPSG
jgi:hypothetical protein